MACMKFSTPNDVAVNREERDGVKVSVTYTPGGTLNNQAAFQPPSNAHNSQHRSSSNLRHVGMISRSRLAQISHRSQRQHSLGYDHSICVNPKGHSWKRRRTEQTIF